MPPTLTRNLINAAKLLATVHLFTRYVGYSTQTEGPSMLPTLNVYHDQVWVSTLYRRGRGIIVGDVISFKHPLIPGAHASKRVLALPGDFVMIGEGSAERDGGESGDGVQRNWKGKGEGKMIQVPEGHVWVVGDNVDWSRDSRDYGPLPMGLIVGKISTRIWPLGQAKRLEEGFRNMEG